MNQQLMKIFWFTMLMGRMQIPADQYNSVSKDILGYRSFLMLVKKVTRVGIRYQVHSHISNFPHISYGNSLKTKKINNLTRSGYIIERKTEDI